MTENDRDDYPDLVADPPEGYAKLEPIAGRKKHAPRIAWGTVYQSWSDPQKVEFLEKFGASMNHAADLLQKERNALLATCARQEDLLKRAALDQAANAELLQRQITTHNEETQTLSREVVALQAEAKAMAAECRRLRGAD
jgi:hypothetical protein